MFGMHIGSGIGIPTWNEPVGGAPPSPTPYLLLQGGGTDYMLLEDGGTDYLELE